MKAAVTGATGFVGGALVDLLLEEGARVAVLARDATRAPRPDAVSVITGDLDDAAALARLADGADYVFHLAGVTFARTDDAYRLINVDGAARAAHAAKQAGAKFIHASSLSAREPQVSPYAQSKRDSETAIADASGDNDWVALRLPAIYGPGDTATLPFFKLVRAGLALAPRTDPPARASLLFVRDAARAMLAAARADLRGAVYEVGDETPHGREWREIGVTLGNIMNKKVKALTAPRALVTLFHNISRAGASIRGKTPDIRTGQANEFFHPDWSARDNLLSSACGWRPETPLEAGLAETVRWYRDNGLL